MQNSEMSSHPVMHWVSVVDARGRKHLEARWELAAAAPVAAPVTPAAPAPLPAVAAASHAA